CSFLVFCVCFCLRVECCSVFYGDAIFSPWFPSSLYLYIYVPWVRSLPPVICAHGCSCVNMGTYSFLVYQPPPLPNPHTYTQTHTHARTHTHTHTHTHTQGELFFL